MLSLIKKYDIPEHWEHVAHHMTIKMGPMIDRSLIGKKTKLKVVGIAIGDNVAAVRVKTDGIESEKEMPHITLAIDKSAGGTPKMSNELTNWRPIGKSFHVFGKVEEEPEKF